MLSLVERACSISAQKIEQSSDQSSERASECHSSHRIYNSLLRMRAIHELKMKNIYISKDTKIDKNPMSVSLLTVSMLN